MDKEYIVPVVLILIAFTFSIGIGLFKATQEAKTFNKFSERDATTWDALFADLRVEACRQN